MAVDAVQTPPSEAVNQPDTDEPMSTQPRVATPRTRAEARTKWDFPDDELLVPAALAEEMERELAAADAGGQWQRFRFVDVTSPGAEGTINLFFDGDCVAWVNNPMLAARIREHLGGISLPLPKPPVARAVNEVTPTKPNHE